MAWHEFETNGVVRCRCWSCWKEGDVSIKDEKYSTKNVDEAS